MRTLLLMLLLSSTCFAGEREEVERLAPGYNAITEFRLWDASRVDMINDEYAIEVDWAYKWAEGVGQCLYYAEMTGRKPALLLLIKDDKQVKYIFRAHMVCAKHGIKLYLEKTKP